MFSRKQKLKIPHCFSPPKHLKMFFRMNLVFIFTTRKILPTIHKDVLPSLQQSMVVYQYVCRCDCRYVGRTSQKLQDRINQHIPRCIRSDKRPTKTLPNRECKITCTPSVYCDSAIGQHLLENKECAKHFNDAQFLFWLQQDFHSIYQFLKQPTSIPYSLFYAVKRNSFIHSKFHINFFLTFPTKPKQYFSTNQIARMTNFDQSENDRKFSIFSILLH